MLAALVAGQDGPAALAAAGPGAAAGEDARSWSGRWPAASGAHQRFLLAQQLAHIDFLDDDASPRSAPRSRSGCALSRRRWSG